MKKLARLWKRPYGRNGKEGFKYVLLWCGDDGKDHWQSLGHSDTKKAGRQLAQKERELRMGYVAPESMRLSEFMEDSMERIGKQVRESSKRESASIMNNFIETVGDVDYRQIRHEQVESYIRKCLDAGNRPATVNKKVRHLKRVFQLAVDRGHLDENPLRRIKEMKTPRKKVNVFTMDECSRILMAAKQSSSQFRWDLVIMLAVTTGLRRGEILNLTWADIDFENETITIAAKANTDCTWEWQIKDADQRTLPVPEDLIVRLAELQSQQPEGYPYVFVPSSRYDFIQQLRQDGKWDYCCSRLKVIENFNRVFPQILRRAGITRRCKFHDFRSTALSMWLRNGLSEFEVMNLAGHSSFATTHEFYLAVADDLVEKSRKAGAKAFGNLLQNHCKSDFSPEAKKADNCNQLSAQDLPNG